MPPTPIVLIDYRAQPADLGALTVVAQALQKQVNQQFGLPAPAGWGCDVIVRAAHAGNPLGADEWWLGLFDRPDQPGALGYHEHTPAGLPLMKVFPALCEQDGVPWSSCASHELLETLADPECSWASQDVLTGNFYALEVCDPVEADTYDVDGVQVSNFVTPSYFGMGDRYDYMGTLVAPFTLRPGGYCQVFVPGQGWTQNTSDKPRAYRVAVPGRRRLRAIRFTR